MGSHCPGWPETETHYAGQLKLTLPAALLPQPPNARLTGLVPCCLFHVIISLIGWLYDAGNKTQGLLEATPVFFSFFFFIKFINYLLCIQCWHQLLYRRL